jgi:protein-tyrosine phosphatase
MGNICRSPTAEGVFRKHVAALNEQMTVEIDSAGTHAYHVGEAPDARAVAAARRRGIDISRQRARAVTASDFDSFELILAMDEDNLAILEGLQPEGSRARLDLLLRFSEQSDELSVPDPYYGGATGFERVLDLLDDACQGLIEHMRHR